MKHFPQDIVDQANQIRVNLENGVHWSQVGGHRHLQSDRIVFKLKRWYRLVCWNLCQTPLRIDVMTHERYNSISRNTRR